MISLRDASRTPVRFPVVTVALIVVNVLACRLTARLFERHANGDAAVAY